MKKTRFTETQIMGILDELDAGIPVGDLSRKHSVSDSAIYKWRTKFGGMTESDLKRLRQLEEENHRLKHMYAELSIDHRILKDIVEKKAIKPAERRKLVDYAVKEHQASINRACRLLNISRSAYHYRSKLENDDDIKNALNELAHKYRRYGFEKMFQKLKQRDHSWNHKRVYRVYCEMKLNLRRKPKKRLPSRDKVALAQPGRLNVSWSMDFMSDALINGKRFRTLNIIDDCNREALGIRVSLSLPAKRVTEFLDQITCWRGYPFQIRVDNGPENISKELVGWAKNHGVTIRYIQPGKPAQNAYIERFNRTYREEILDMHLFRSIDHVQAITDEWLYEYNNERPHQSLGNLTPRGYIERGIITTNALY